MKEYTEQKIHYTLEATPWYFGAYLNIARHNIYLISNEISRKLKLKRKLCNEEQIADSFLVKKDFIEKQNINLIYTNLVRFLPLARMFSTDILDDQLSEKELDISEWTSTLKVLFSEINSFRNNYSHYYSSETLSERKVKVHTDFADHIKDIFSLAVLSAEQRFRGVLPGSSFRFVEKEILPQLFNDRCEISTRGLIFFISLFLDKENAFHLFNKVSGFKNTTTFDFLATREVFSVLCIKLPHDKFISENPDQALQLDILNYLNRAPKELFQALSEEGRKQFLPDFPELVRSRIIENSTSDDVEEYRYEEYIQAISSKKRSEDRFPEFALKYLDQSDSFKFSFHILLGKSKIRGYKKPLLGALPEENNRSIIRDMTTFGQLKTYLGEDARDRIVLERMFCELFKGDDIEYFTQYAPFYHIANNKIGILSHKNRKYSGMLYRPLQSDAFLSIHELPKVALLEVLDKGSASAIIDAFLEKNIRHILNETFIRDIKNRLSFDKTLYRFCFDEKLSDPQPVDPDAALEEVDVRLAETRDTNELKRLNVKRRSLRYAKYVQEVNERKKGVNQLLTEYDLNVRQIPSRILDYWLDIRMVRKETTFQNRIKAERKACKKRLKDLEKGKGPRIGEMASYLARDIVDLVLDRGIKDKITSFYYDILQSSLALYADPDKKRLFLDVCSTELGLFDKKKGHPFLGNINFDRIRKTKELYKIYLELKGVKERTYGSNKYGKHSTKAKQDNWLYNTFYTIQKNKKTGKDETFIKLPEDSSLVPVTYLRFNEDRSDLDTWLSTIAQGSEHNPNPKAVDLPTNLFDEQLVMLLKGKVGITEGSGKRYNFSKLLSLLRNDTQPFYNDKREYILFKDTPYEVRVAFDPLSSRKFSEHYQEAMNQSFRIRKKMDKRIQPNQVRRVFKKAIDENEKQIRFYQAKDRITLLMLKDMIGRDLGFSLNAVSPQAPQNPLNMPVELSEIIHSKTITHTCKRKDFSIFRKLLSDRRLSGLFQYFDSDIIPYEILRKELSDYERYKEQVFKTVFDLEKQIIAVMSEEELNNLKATSGTNIQHKPYLDWLADYGILTREERAFCIEVRNKLSHNQFPDKAVMDTFVGRRDSTQTNIKQIVSAYITIVNTLIATKLLAKR